MSRKGGQNKGKDGGALLDPHGRTVSVKVNEDGNLEVIPDDDNDVHMVEALGSLQNGDPASSSITITASGKPLGVASPGSLQPDSPIPLLDAIRQVNHSEWLKKNLDGVGFDTQSHHDELDGHLASDSKEVCQLFVLADGVGNGAPAEDGVPAADGLGSGGQPVAVSRGSASEVPEQGGQVLANHLAVTNRTNSELSIKKSSNKKEDTLEMVSDIHVQAVTESNSKQSLNVFNPESSDTDDLGIPVLEFQDLQQSNSKNNTLLTPQELENIPDECLDLDETMENSMEDFVKKIWRGTSNITDLPVTSGVSLLSDNEVNKISNSDNDMIVNAAISQIMNESSAAEVATSLKLPSSAVCSETAVTQASVNSSPVLAYNNGSSVVLPSPVISVSQVPTSPVISQMGTSGAVSTSTLPANCTLATIYISTDKGANSTQIRVNAGGSQQLYQLNTASLTGAPPLATVVQNTAPPTPVVPPVQKTGEIVSPSGDSLTGYLLLPVGQSDTNGILMSVPLGSVAKGGEEHVLEPSEIPPGTAYDSTTKIWHCLEDGCGKAFKKQSKLRIHQMRHTGERPFRCTRPGCGWAFTTGYKLRRHEESHEGRKDYICDIDGCKRKFTTIYNLNSHRRLHERPCNEICQEPGCGERFHTKRQLDLHMKNHVGAEKNYKCPVSGCDKVFFSPNCMGSHARVHQQEREDLTCKFEGCGKTFEKLCRLRQHMRSHTGEKPYICTYDGCGWAFTTASKLTRHMNKHTGERRWECPIEGCGKAFMRAEHLKGHVVTHSGARPFLCPVEGCNSRFTAKSSLYVHLKKHDHSGEKIIYFCPMEGCEKKYATKSCLRNHITKHYSTPVADSDHAHFDLVPLLAGEDLPEESLDSFTAPQGDNVTTPVSAVNINTSIATSLLGTADPVLISPSDYITSGVDQPVITTTSFPSDGLTQQLTTQYIVSGDLPTPGVFSGALMGVPPPPGSPVSVCTSCSSPTLACSCSQSPETTAGPSTGSGGKHKAKIAIGQGASQRVLQENSSGSARTDYRSNYMLSDRAKKRRLMLKEKVDLPTMPVPTAVVVNGNLVTLGDNGTTFRAAEVLNSQGITYRDPDTGTTYVQTQLLQDDPPNPDLFPDDTTLTSDLVTLHDPSSSDVSAEFTGTTINLQDLE